VAYKLDLLEVLSRVYNTFHVSNLRKCHADEPLAVPLDGLHFDDKLYFVEEPVEIVDREVKRLKFQPSDGYHDVPHPYTGTFMPPKPDLVFNTAPTAVKTDHSAFNVETSIPAATPKLASLKPASSGKRRNRKACFVCKSMDHLIKDCDFHAKKIAQPTPRNHAHRGTLKQYAQLTHTNPQKHMVPVVVLTQSKPVSITTVRPVSVVVSKIKVTRPRYANPIVTKSKSPIRRHLTRSPSPMTSNSPPRVTAVKALVPRWDYDPGSFVLLQISLSRSDPTPLNNSEMAAEGPGALPVPDLQTMEELCQPSLNGRGGPIAPIAIQAANFGLKNDMIQQSRIPANFMVCRVNQQVKTVTPSYETCGSPHSFSDCPATIGNTQNVYVARAYQGTLPGNTITNPKDDLKGITTRSETAYPGPTIPNTSSSPVVERETEATKDMVHPTNNESTKDVQPLVFPTKSPILNSEPVISPIIEPVASPVRVSRPNQRPSIPYPSRLQDQKLRDKANEHERKFSKSSRI
nr:reverse transcriptase domain-containing protein [Tanacetum cinerariifolium]